MVDTSQIKPCLSFQYGHTKPLTFLKCSIPLTSFHCAVLAFLPNFLASLFFVSLAAFSFCHKAIFYSYFIIRLYDPNSFRNVLQNLQVIIFNPFC